MSFLETTAGLIILRCDNYLNNRGITDTLVRFPSLQDVLLKLDDESLQKWAQVDPEDKDIKKNLPDDPEQARYLSVLDMMGGGSVMQSLLDLSIALFTFPEFGAYLTTFFGYSVNLHLAFLLENIEFPTEDEILSAVDSARILMYVDTKSSPMQYSELTFDERTMGYLFGSDTINPLIEGFTVRFKADRDKKSLHEVFLYKELVGQGASFFKKKGKILQLSGKGGRRFLTKNISVDLKKDFLFVSLPDLLRESGRERFDEFKDALIREARFDDAGICFYGITENFLRGGNDGDIRQLSRDLEVMEHMLFEPIKKAGIPIVLCADTSRPLLAEPKTGEYLLIELPEKTGYEERKTLWTGFSKLYKLSLDPENFAMRYNLNASEISRVVKSFLERCPDAKDIGTSEEEIFTRICMQRAETETDISVGRVIYPTIRLDDVKIKPASRAVLDDVVAGIRKSGQILDEWGLRKNYPYGRSVSLLMTGPPGTGKTMTANALAGELGFPLYQVNLSNIVDKYIGETEKNLERAFSFAEKTDAVLFFDEADALFGTRSEVHDSKDRFANTQVSYLLQRMEAYDGIVIMASNIKTNIDSAFMRRIRYVLHYENPDEALRREIWKSCITDRIPHDDIDFDYLAAQFKDFTGSVIKTVFLNACAYAAGKDEKLGMAHLIYAIRHELNKNSTVAFSNDALGKYAYL